MKKELSPVQIAVILIVVVALVGGVGYWFTMRGASIKGKRAADKATLLKSLKTGGGGTGPGMNY